MSPNLNQEVMKSETNRALWAKKKNYNQPIVGAEEFLMSNQALCTSPTPGTLPNSGSGTGDLGGGEIIGG